MAGGVNDVRAYGPEPTGLVFAYLTGSGTLAQTCFDTTGVCLHWVWYEGLVKVMTAVVAVGAVAPASGSSLVLRALYLRSRSKVNATSSAVKGCPSDHFTPSRTVRVSERPSASQ